MDLCGWMMVTRGQFRGKLSDDTKLGDVSYYEGRSSLAEGPSYDETLGNQQQHEVQQNCAGVRFGARKKFCTTKEFRHWNRLLEEASDAPCLSAVKRHFGQCPQFCALTFGYP